MKRGWEGPPRGFGKEKILRAAVIGTRFRTGETAPVAGIYEFDRYLDGTSAPAPTNEERRITLSRGETFPPIRSAEKACYWRLIRQL